MELSILAFAGYALAGEGAEADRPQRVGPDDSAAAEFGGTSGARSPDLGHAAWPGADRCD